MRKIIPLHHATIVDEASAPEGGKFIPHSEEWTQGRGPIPKVPRNRGSAKGAGVVLAVVIGCLLAVSLVHWWSS